MGEDQLTDPRPPIRFGLTITTAEDPADGVRLTAVGALDYTSAAVFVAAVQRAFDAGATAVTADVAGIGFSDSSGLAAFIRAHQTAEGTGRRFAVANPDHNLSRIFALTGLNMVFQVTGNPAADGD